LMDMEIDQNELTTPKPHKDYETAKPRKKRKPLSWSPPPINLVLLEQDAISCTSMTGAVKPKPHPASLVFLISTQETAILTKTWTSGVKTRKFPQGEKEGLTTRQLSERASMK
jgi:hypothetical protein